MREEQANVRDILSAGHGEEPAVTIMGVSCAGKTLINMVQERIESGSMAMTDEHIVYKSLKERRYDYHTVNHGED